MTANLHRYLQVIAFLFESKIKHWSSDRWLYKSSYIVLEVCLSDTLKYLLEWLVFDLKGLTQNLAYVGIVHVREGLEDLAPLVLGPHHECIHWPFNVGLVVVPSSGFPEDSRLCRSSASCWPTIIGLGFICRAIYLPGPCNSQSRNKKIEPGKTLVKWQAMFKLSFIHCHHCYHHHEHCFRWVQDYIPS